MNTKQMKKALAIAARRHPEVLKAKPGQKFMVMMLDPEECPRAYGVAPTVERAREIAQQQLAIYRKKKLEVEDHYLATATYTERVELLNEEG